jgi:hypothetical protein
MGVSIIEETTKYIQIRIETAVRIVFLIKAISEFLFKNIKWFGDLSN